MLPLPLDCMLSASEVIPDSDPLPLERMVAVGVLRLPSSTDPEPDEATSTDLDATPELTSKDPEPVEPMEIDALSRTPVVTEPDPLALTSTD
mmetsp:Transcript_34635/g.104561  ORF Transcript_34635/g.104561 Transcript_34635/m.104561 type:complete len:92 (+) Transcript_34635:360-635(+)